MGKIFLLIILLTPLTLQGSLGAKEGTNKKEHVVLRGIIKSKSGDNIKFNLKDKLNGNYQLIIFENEPTKDSHFIIKKGTIIKDILKEKIWSKIDTMHLKKENDITYLSIFFSNEELMDHNHLQILFLGVKTIFELEKRADVSISAKLE